jgi:NADPH-dependent curcumin reductase CurA
MNQCLASVIDRPPRIIFMAKTASREIRLASRPKGIPTAASKETVVKGIGQVVGAFIGPFEGKNIGKMVVKLG